MSVELISIHKIIKLCFLTSYFSVRFCPRVNSIKFDPIQAWLLLNSRLILILVIARNLVSGEGDARKKQHILEGNSTLFSKFLNFPPIFPAEIKYLQSNEQEMAPEVAWFNIGDGAI